MIVAWSGGKDSAWALHVLRRRSGVEVAGLFTTVNEDTGRVAVHEVPGALLREQAAAADAPLHTVPIPRPCPNDVYERGIAQFVAGAKSAGVTHLAFGDLFLEDIRRYRERQFAGSGVELLFVDPSRAPRDWVGKVFDPAFVAAVPEGIDPCGENGEFHTFVFEGPMLRRPVRVTAIDLLGSSP